jgi:hypothetical protein
MHVDQKKIEGTELLEKIQDESYWKNKSTLKFIERAHKAENDSERKNRLKSNLCKYCYYLRGSVIAGQAITTSPCKICTEEMIFSSTDTDKICTGCAKKHKICKQCMADIDYNKRRKV